MSAEEAIEDLADVVNETAKLVEAKDVSSADGLYISKSGLARLSFLAGFVVVGAGFVGYAIAEKQLRTKYEQIAAQEIADAKAFYAIVKKEGMETPEKAVQNLIDPTIEDAARALVKYSGQPEPDSKDNEDEETEEGVVEISENVFVKNAGVDDDTFDLEEEMKTRTPDEPYVINQQEFLVNESGFTQTSITYYKGDGTLADEEDREIPVIDEIVGQENLYRFGHGSGDPRIVFVRNERISTDFEVVLSDGKYAYEVLGFEHSDGGARGRRQVKEPRRFRGSDE